MSRAAEPKNKRYFKISENLILVMQGLSSSILHSVCIICLWEPVKHVYTASKSAPIRYYKLNPSSLPIVRASFSPVSGKLLGFESCSMLSFGRRHFCVGRNQNGKLRPMVKYLSYLTVFFKKFETVPFTKQTLLVHPFVDKLLRDSVVENIRDLLRERYCLILTHTVYELERLPERF